MMSPSAPRLSVLDLIPVRSDQSSADAVAATVRLARRADEFGYARYWVAEHHNMPSVASTSPAVVLGALATATPRIRLGSGGVMLPNHAPLVVAEQFAALEALSPGRIDLGLGRAPGSDPVVTALLRASGPTSEVDRFPQHVREILALLSPSGAELELTSGRSSTVRATPRPASSPAVWILGSSDSSANLAARLGLPYAFAHHFSATGTEHALHLYRTGFQPSEHLPEPRVIVTANVVAADSLEEAEALALPQLQHLARLRTGEVLTPLDTVEQARERVLSPLQDEVLERMRAGWIVGDGSGARTELEALTERFAADEVMVSPVASAFSGGEPAASAARERTLELLAS